MAEQRKSFDHKVAVAHTTFTGNCFYRLGKFATGACSGTKAHGCYPEAEEDKGISERQGNWRRDFSEQAMLLTCMAAVSGSQSSEGQQCLGVFMAQGLSIVSEYGVRFCKGMQNRQALNS